MKKNNTKNNFLKAFSINKQHKYQILEKMIRV